MADWDRESFENAVIADMREHGGVVTSGPLAGHPLLILTTLGAKTGKDRRAILTYTRDGGDYVVAGTAGGSPTTPSWVHNLESEPHVTIEVANRASAATATIVGAGERDRLWEQHVAALPNFADYPAQAGRVIPVIRITPSRED
jgi:deazaflavin-dependent oxidoreductase (nitroreductase family)